MKRFIAVLICALMLTSLLPSVAFAEEGDPAQMEGRQEGQNLTDGEQQGLKLTGSNPAPTATETVTISAGATPSDAGSVTGSGTYDKGTQVSVTATAKEGYVFVAWKENGGVLTT